MERDIRYRIKKAKLTNKAVIAQIAPICRAGGYKPPHEGEFSEYIQGLKGDPTNESSKAYLIRRAVLTICENAGRD